MIVRWTFVLLLVAASPAGATISHCTSAAHRQFDFWIGSWTVKDPKGVFQGTNAVTLEYGACVVAEHWKDVSGSTGGSFNMYDARDDRWHQTWVDSNGLRLALAGGLSGRAMVLAGMLAGMLAGPKGPTLQRITWTPLVRGDVRQLWELSRNGGKTWSTVFDGHYTKRR